MGFRVLAGPPELGFPAAGLMTSDGLLKENPQFVKRTLRALLKANRFILENRQQTIQVMVQWLQQSPQVAARSYDSELKSLSKDGQMTDDEMKALMERISDKKRPLDEVRDFSLVRQALKELDLHR
jgi:ABC-type nitrate/sulfonate/bicarbonate transport system substrate-binding protein